MTDVIYDLFGKEIYDINKAKSSISVFILSNLFIDQNINEISLLREKDKNFSMYMKTSRD